MSATVLSGFSPVARPLRERLPCGACAVRSFATCRAISSGDLEDLAYAGETSRIYPAGAKLVEQGQPIRHVFDITSGAVMLSRLLENGRRQVLDFLFAGDFIGLPFEGSYSYSAYAIGPVRACRLPCTQFAQLVAESPKLQEELMARASHAISDAQDHIVALGSGNAVERVASFLNMISRKERVLDIEEDLILLPMTRQCIADYLGITLETVSRAMTALKRRSIIELTSPTQVRILSLPLLLVACGGA